MIRSMGCSEYYRGSKKWTNVGLRVGFLSVLCFIPLTFTDATNGLYMSLTKTRFSRDTSPVGKIPKYVSKMRGKVTGRKPGGKGQIQLKENFGASTDQRRKNLRVVITGGTKGLGRALAEQFIESGDKVMIASRNGDRVRTAVNEMKRMGVGEVAGLKVDITSSDELEKLSQYTRDMWGGADMWICNAATNGYLFKELESTPTDVIKEVAATNIMGTLLTAREGIRSMQKREGPGFIILLEGAGGGGDPTPKYAAYGVTKAGIRQLASSLTSELRTSKLQVITLNPGLVDTELLRSGKDAFGDVGQFLVDIIKSSPQRVAVEVVPQLREIALEKINLVEDNGWLSKQIQKAGADYRSLFPRSVSILTPRNILRKLTKVAIKGGPLSKLAAKTYAEGVERYISERQTQAKIKSRVLTSKVTATAPQISTPSINKRYYEKGT